MKLSENAKKLLKMELCVISSVSAHFSNCVTSCENVSKCINDVKKIVKRIENILDSENKRTLIAKVGKNE